MKQFMHLWPLHPNKDHSIGMGNLCGNTNCTGIIYSKKAFPPPRPDKCVSNGPLSDIAHHSNTIWLTHKATSHAFLLPFQTHYLCVALDGLQEICWSIHTNPMQNFTLSLDHSLCDSLGIPSHLSQMSAHDPPPRPLQEKNGRKTASGPSPQLLLLKGPMVFHIRGLENNHTTVSKLQELYWQDWLAVALSTDCISCLPAKTHCPWEMQHWEMANKRGGLYHTNQPSAEDQWGQI